VLLEPKETLELTDCQAPKVREVQMVSEAILALQVSQVKLVSPVQMVLLVIQEHQDRPVLLVNWDPQVLQDPRETKDSKVQPVARVT
jgi:hypothetical protein